MVGLLASIGDQKPWMIRWWPHSRLLLSKPLWITWCNLNRLQYEIGSRRTNSRAPLIGSLSLQWQWLVLWSGSLNDGQWVVDEGLQVGSGLFGKMLCGWVWLHGLCWWVTGGFRCVCFVGFCWVGGWERGCLVGGVGWLWCMMMGQVCELGVLVGG